MLIFKNVWLPIFRLIVESENVNATAMILLLSPLLNLSPLDLLALKESLHKGEVLPLERVRSILIASGVADERGRIVSSDLLSEFLILSQAEACDRDAFISVLDKSDPRRRFNDFVLTQNDSQNAQILLEAIEKRVGEPHVPMQQKVEFPQMLFNAFLDRGDFSGEQLGAPSLSQSPHRILWAYRGDVSAGFEKYFSEEERAHVLTYRLVQEGRIDELQKIHGSRSIPAFKAWNSIGAPPVLKAHFFLHIGKNSLRASLYCTERKKPSDSRSNEPSALVLKVKSAMESAASQFNGTWIVAGPPSHKNLSLSKNISKKSIDNIASYIDSTISVWGECYEILKAMRA